MSHFTTIQTQIRDAAALRDACQELGVELIENAEARGYGSNKRKGYRTPPSLISTTLTVFFVHLHCAHLMEVHLFSSFSNDPVRCL